MSRRTRFLVAVSIIISISIPAVALTLAQPPTKPRKVLELPDLPDDFKRTRIPSNADPEVQRIIRERLEQGNFEETGNPVIDDILQLMKKVGPSVLKDSSLDPAADQHAIKKPANAVSAKARAAECLLKAARNLEKIEPLDKTRRDLVNQMRRESVRLLTEWIPKSQDQQK